MMATHRPFDRIAVTAGLATQGQRTLPEEVAIALSYNGTTQAVMMASPAALEDFAVGFSLTEGIARPDEIDSITIVETLHGVDVQIWLLAAAKDRLSARRRTMAGPVGCGLCGIDSLEEATRLLPTVPPSAFRLTPAQVCAAVAGVPTQQTLQDATRAAHAAALWVPEKGIVALREDVGRHNALDKLAGAIARGAGQEGAVVITSRLSIDLVQKCAAMRQPILIAASAPTGQAVTMAAAMGITLVALARADRFEVFTHPDRITTGTNVHIEVRSVG